MQVSAKFWDNISEKYRTTPISDETAYAYTLERVGSYLKPKDHVLELGCGTGGSAVQLAKFAGHITATDFSVGMIAQAKARPAVANVDFQVADVFDRQFASETFDAVLGFNLFHLVPDFKQQLSQTHKLLRTGGLFISKTPCLTDPTAQLKYRLIAKVVPLMQLIGKAPFVEFRTIAQYQRAIETAGFEIIETGNYPAQPPAHFIVARKV